MADKGVTSGYRGNSGLEGVTGGYNGLQGVPGGCKGYTGLKGVQGITGGYKGLKVITRGYRDLGGFTRRCRKTFFYLQRPHILFLAIFCITIKVEEISNF